MNQYNYFHQSLHKYLFFYLSKNVCTFGSTAVNLADKLCTSDGTPDNAGASGFHIPDQSGLPKCLPKYCLHFFKSESEGYRVKFQHRKTAVEL